MATKKNGKVLVQVTLSEVIYQKLRRMAFDEEVTVNTMIRQIIEKTVSKK